MIACLSPNGGAETQGDSPLEILKVATVSGLYTLKRGEAGDWSVGPSTLTGLHVGALLLEPRSGWLFAGCHGDGGLWTTHGGGLWRKLNGGLTHAHIYTLAAQSLGEEVRLWAGLEPASLFRSDDLGASWVELDSLRQAPDHEKWTFPPPPHVGHVKNVAFHPADPERLYVCVEQGGFFMSPDGGRSWTELLGYLRGDEKFYRDAHRCVIRPSDPKALYLATGDGLCFSDDGGERWRRLTDRTHRVGYPDALAIDPRDEQVLYMAGSKGAPEDWREEHSADAAVVVSRDGGRSWEEIGQGLPHPMRGNIEAMSVHRFGDDLALVIGTATGEVFLSEDAGDHWRLIAEDLPPISKAGHYRWFLSEEARHQVETGMRRWGRTA